MPSLVGPFGSKVLKEGVKYPLDQALLGQGACTMCPVLSVGDRSWSLQPDSFASVLAWTFGSIAEYTSEEKRSSFVAVVLWALAVMLAEAEETWLILPVVICLSQRLSHACLSISFYMVKLRMAH